MKRTWCWLMVAAVATCAAAGEQADKAALTRQLWPKERIEAALKAIEKQRQADLLSDAAYQKRKKMPQRPRILSWRNFRAGHVWQRRT